MKIVSYCHQANNAINYFHNFNEKKRTFGAYTWTFFSGNFHLISQNLSTIFLHVKLYMMARKPCIRPYYKEIKWKLYLCVLMRTMSVCVRVSASAISTSNSWILITTTDKNIKNACDNYTNRDCIANKEWLNVMKWWNWATNYVCGYTLSIELKHNDKTS